MTFKPSKGIGRMNQPEEKSFLQTHPTIRKIVLSACVLIGIAALGSMFGWDRVAGWIEGGARTAGVEITQGASK